MGVCRGNAQTVGGRIEKIGADAENGNPLEMDCRFVLVRAWGLEPQRRKAREPKSRMSTNSIMPAKNILF